MKNELYIKDLFGKRSFFMGFAMLWIILYHSGISVNIACLGQFINAVKAIGYGGVDIFLLCSAIGCYHSLKRDSDYLAFIKRRFWRIYPTWFVFITIWIICKGLVDGISFNAIIGNYFCIQDFTSQGDSFNWYISAIWLFYLLTPYLYCICNKLNLKANLFVIILLGLLSMAFWNNNTLIITISRLPIFYLGLLFAKYKNAILNAKSIFLAILITIFGCFFLLLNYFYFPEYLWAYALWWYPFIFITPGLCIALYGITQILTKLKLNCLVDFISHIGTISFEIYLIHIFIFSVFSHFKVTNNLLYFLTIILIILASSIYSKFISFLLQKIRRSKAPIR